MSVLIKGMDMPKHCGKCRFSVNGWCYAANELDRTRITTNSCPLVEVPKHGRLIDADATLDVLRRLGERDYRRTKGTICDAIKMVASEAYTPTVIEAEE